MPTYLLQWEAIRWAKAQGARQYDLYGIPDLPEAELESKFIQRSDGLWGVYRFKRGFGGEIHRSTGPWDRVYHPFIYHAYQLLANRTTYLG
jgi:lipid II:glycine glycyltransferase (peptidoglycan interpeptide bridge formation enzyme)